MEFAISDNFAEAYADKDPGWGFNGLGYIVYKRTYARPVAGGERTEEWHETIQRVVNGAQAIGAGLTQEEAEVLYDKLFHLKGSVAGRMLWQLGTDNNTRIGGDSLVNCWFVDVQCPEDFSWAIDRLMLGGGVGFSCNQPERLGMVRNATVTHSDVNDADFIVPDTREGWSELIERVVKTFVGGPEVKDSLTFATHLVRPYGEPIHGFGGTASGPDILIQGALQIADVMSGAAGRHLNSVEVLDILNIIGSIVVAGNVRRSAEIALGDVEDESYMMAKRWDLGNVPNYRAMSNNSVFVSNEQMERLALDPEANIWSGYKGNGEPYGFFNLENSREFGRMGEIRRDDSVVGVNPCAEIPLAHRESCNLCEIYLPRIDSLDELIEVSSLLYKVQKAIAAMPYIDHQSDVITSQNMRLGLGVTGVAQALDKIDWLDEAYVELRKLDEEWSAERGWPESVRLTTVKPSGTLSLLPGVTPGVHPGFSSKFVKRMRIAADHPLVQFCADHGYDTYPVLNFDGTEDARTSIIDFPCEFPEGTVLAEDLTAIEQMDLVRKLQRVWADNAVSVTVYYRMEELPGIMEYLAEYWKEMKSVSFLLHSDHGFAQAPLGELTEEEYAEMVGALTPFGTDHVEENTAMELDDADCATGACPIR